MIRHPNLNERQTTHSPTYWAEELVKLRDLKSRVDEYGGMLRLRSDILKLEHELEFRKGRYLWARPVVFNTNERDKK